MAEQKLFIIPCHPNKNWWGQCKCKKVSGTIIGGHCQPLGDGDPKRKYRKVSRTKIAEQKLVGTLGHWVTGTPNASAKRSAEQKRQNKNSRTKMAEQKLFIIPSHPNKNWWGQCKCKKVSGTNIGGRNKNSRTKIGGQNQKMVSGTKIGERNRKQVSGTKIGERNKNSGTKIGGWNKKKVSGTKIGEHCQQNKNYLSGNVVNAV